MIAPVETQRMLVLSTSHLREATCNKWITADRAGFYPKGDYGWFAHVVGDVQLLLSSWDDKVPNGKPPNELLMCMSFAAEHHFDWIMFDRDGPIQPGLVVYDW